ncbi:MAG: uracil-DNA glycosylase [Candidatus Pacebacteria bacterium]|nr:uracil-DNA glycosylase [Candidatus Paceibacterota bacterium]PIR61136.1 MAG: uracil-DNA glycosylase [Candidatus Pacebacteria bacterium CG10_big_fil_rev_8_21_14_0_10_45_6]
MNAAAQLVELYATLQNEASLGNLLLARSQSDIVPGEGSPTADILFIGEAPGYQESVDHRPFVGRSGKLLRQVLEQIGLAPEEYYISNIVKVRPPDNRDPSPEEIEAFRPYLNQEIAILQPKLIVTLGRFSMAKFLPDVRISQVHGRLHQVVWNEQNQYVLPMYHPAAALRATRTKEQFILDMQKIPKALVWVQEQHETKMFKQQVATALL